MLEAFHGTLVEIINFLKGYITAFRFYASWKHGFATIIEQHISVYDIYLLYTIRDTNKVSGDVSMFIDNRDNCNPSKYINIDI